MTTTKYIASNTSSQVIDTFDIPTSKMIEYEIHINAYNDTTISYVSVHVDGNSSSELQRDFTTSNVRPAEFTTSINNDICSLSVTPLQAPSTYTIVRNIIEPEYYAEHTTSGKLIPAASGAGFDYDNFYYTIRGGNSSNTYTFIPSYTWGPVVVGDELFVLEELESYNDADIETDGTLFTFRSSGQHRSHHYKAIETIPGTRYRVSFDGYYTFTEVRGDIDTYDVGVRVAIGNDISSEDILYQYITSTSQSYDIDFTATSTTTYVGFGFGALGTAFVCDNLTIKELVPFPTYKQKEGTIMIQCSAIAINSNILEFGNNRVYVDGSNNVFINNVNCGSQNTTTTLAFKYNSNGALVYAYNSNLYSNNINIYGDVEQVVLNSSIRKFSYTPTQVSNTVLQGLLNV